MRRGLKVLLVASGLAMTAYGLFGPIYALFVESIGGDLITAGLAYSIYSIATGLMIFFISRTKLAESRAESLIVAGFGLGVIGTIGYLFVREPLHLYIVELIFGLSEAIRLPSYDGLFSSMIEDGKYAKRWGLWDAMYFILTGITAIIGGVIAQLIGFTTLFYIMVLISLLGFIASLGLYSKKGLTRFMTVRTRR